LCSDSKVPNENSWLKNAFSVKIFGLFFLVVVYAAMTAQLMMATQCQEWRMTLFGVVQLMNSISRLILFFVVDPPL